MCVIEAARIVAVSGVSIRGEGADVLAKHELTAVYIVAVWVVLEGGKADARARALVVTLTGQITDRHTSKTTFDAHRLVYAARIVTIERRAICI